MNGLVIRSYLEVIGPATSLCLAKADWRVDCSEAQEFLVTVKFKCIAIASNLAKRISHSSNPASQTSELSNLTSIPNSLLYQLNTCRSRSFEHHLLHRQVLRDGLNDVSPSLSSQSPGIFRLNHHALHR